MLQKPRSGSISEKVSSYFIEERFGDNTHKCTINDCTRRLNGKKNHNLVAHVKSVHNDIYRKFVRPELDESYYMKIRLELIQKLTEIVTVNGRPFSYLNDSGFTKIIQEKLDELKIAGHGIDLHSNNYTEIKTYIQLVADKINNRIKAELIDCLSNFDVTIRQVISITTDNGSNLLAMVNILNDEELEILLNEDDLHENDEGAGPSALPGNSLAENNTNETSESVCLQIQFYFFLVLSLYSYYNLFMFYFHCLDFSTIRWLK